jgi:hypothetical protein
MKDLKLRDKTRFKKAMKKEESLIPPILETNSQVQR